MPPGRPRQFDQSELLGKAMDFFWTHGFKGGGIADLVRHVGVGRQTIYSTFGSKRGLFVAVIKHYRENHLAKVLETLARPGSPILNVTDALRFFETLANDKQARGCLVANSLVEIGSEDGELSAILEETLGMLEASLLAALEAAQACGELPAGKTPKALSRALTNSMVGMAVTGRMHKGKAVLADICAGTLEMLN